VQGQAKSKQDRRKQNFVGNAEIGQNRVVQAGHTDLQFSEGTKTGLAGVQEFVAHGIISF
jgi:hypothetical protein